MKGQVPCKRKQLVTKTAAAKKMRTSAKQVTKSAFSAAMDTFVANFQVTFKKLLIKFLHLFILFYQQIPEIVFPNPVLDQTILELASQLFTEDEAATRVDSEPTKQSAPDQSINPEPQTQLHPSTPCADSNQQETAHMASPIPSMHTEPGSPEDADVCNSFTTVSLLEIQSFNQLSPIDQKFLSTAQLPSEPRGRSSSWIGPSSPDNTVTADLQEPEVICNT